MHMRSLVLAVVQAPDAPKIGQEGAPGGHQGDREDEESGPQVLQVHSPPLLIVSACVVTVHRTLTKPDISLLEPDILQELGGLAI
jgi:hypothetical protein